MGKLLILSVPDHEEHSTIFTAVCTFLPWS